MRRPLRLLAAALTLALTGAPASTLAATPPSAHARTGASKPATPTRRAKSELPAAARAGRGSMPVESKGGKKVEVDARKPDEKKPEPPARSDSVGHPNEGRLEGGMRLDTTKPYLKVVPAYASGDVRWGLPALVRAIDRSAKNVNKKYPGAVLGVGDLSRRGGGDISRHHSHESGRDADLGFYVLDEQDKQVERHGFVKVNAKLEATEVPGARFDVPRNWLFLQTLLLDREARVSHVFVAEPIKQALLAHARQRGVSRAVLTRAAQVMMQPTAAPPHDDHFHVRISCPSSSKKSCVEIAKNAPSKAKAKLARKGRGAVKTPSPNRTEVPAAEPKKASPRRAGTKRAEYDRSAGIYLSRTVKAGEEQDVPVSLWALAGAALGHSDGRATAKDGSEEAEADAAEVKDALDEDGAPKITQ
ncbi:penicillin-insensitive murein endopeptidase [Polyangium aurulentum]|uniref:penicillin-insensitive murein endopeptidase n=1 Tax=Polyangium aurulentum TaxID=2567896 RepID=UPI0010AE0032|nr:penicillin-insensitive murein endopeptidase [Polyangium aurulentum]UQA59716.1 penicillin-insensitive murein endopeptidase [Polyangium aurulentum]